MSACDRPPVVRLTGRSASFSFVVDLTAFDLTDIIYDGLGMEHFFCIRIISLRKNEFFPV